MDSPTSTTTKLINQINNNNNYSVCNNNKNNKNKTIAKHRASLTKMENNGAGLTTIKTTNRALNNIRQRHDRVQKTASLSQMF